MSGHATERLLRVFCPVHRIGFEAVAAGTIPCGAGGHALARDFPREEFWEYCCDCQHYCPSDSAKGGKGREQCLVCDRQIARRYVCDRCKLVSFESDEAVRRKSYSLSPAGVVGPSCPGCLATPAAAARAHHCEEAGAAFVTARPACPFCGESIAEPPSFPSKVADYLGKTKAGRSDVAFDAARRSLVASPGGEFVLVQDAGAGAALALPRAPRFETRQDYYAYETFYRCDEVRAGEIWITHPAVVEKRGDAWFLREAGHLEIRRDESAAAEAAAAAPPSQSELLTRPLADGTRPVARFCPECGAEHKNDHAFCRDCGHRLSETDGRVEWPARPAQVVPLPAGFDPARTHPLDSTSEPLPPPTPERPPSGGRRLGLLVAGIVAVLAVAGVIVAVSVNGVPSTKARLERAVVRGDLFSPPGESAYDLYRRFKSEGARGSELKGVEDRLWPLLTERPKRMLEEFASPRDSDPTLQQWEEAHRLLSWAGEMRPGDSSVAARAAYCQGRIAYINERKDDALAHWKRASDLDKSWALATNGVGLIYNERREYEAARPYLREAVRRDPDWAIPHNNLGTSYYYQRRYDEAEPHYRRAAELSPNWARPHAWLGDIAMLARDYDRAVSEYEAILEPTAVGSTRMDLDRIRQQLEKARRLAAEQQELEEAQSDDANSNAP